ncbi:putative benzoate 4-monooxygenase cytochrome p450 [Diplodia seriata]|uniref:Putative benzoate 4-monooxygenase cytochrome p450 n=1 Tax=Diplodia seriata TaxID=420778 RepID=A0A0G2DWY7_9PEZI|nr:putative benzoate 4-monooxygenase cytochrome p450 [Diplodia seriata]
MTSSGLSPRAALSEAKEMLGPGTDTTSATLAHILWALAHNPAYQDDLFGDLARAGFPQSMNGTGNGGGSSGLDAVPTLKACVKEGVRWAGAAAAMLPRVVPDGGVVLEGVWVPGGTVVSSSPIWYLRDKTAFPNPDEYDPYRWLGEADGGRRLLSSEVALRDRYYIPFSKGSNVCIGAHPRPYDRGAAAISFSYYELYLAVSHVVRNFRIRLPADVDEQLLPPEQQQQQRRQQRQYSRGLLSTISANYSSTTGSFQPVPLPPRREWVAAVPTQKLAIVLEER